MDRSWLHKSRISSEYREGIKSFLSYINETFPNKDKILCPCSLCCNSRLRTLVEVEEHLVCKGFLQGYTIWFCHGEPIPSSPSGDDNDPNFHSPPRNLPGDQTNQTRGDDMQNLIEEGLGIPGFSFGNGAGQEAEQSGGSNLPRNGGEKEARKLQKLMEDATAPLYDGCKSFSRLSFIIRLFHLKCMNGWSNKSFSVLMEMLSQAFPEGNNLPNDSYSTKQYLKAFDLGYEKIHACRNDCILYRGEHENRTTCPVCGEDRYITKKYETDEFEESQVKENKKKPAKVLRYFPLIPRLKRMFMSSKISSSMRWHKNRKRKRGQMVHPSDSKVWESFDEDFPDFTEECRNMKFGIGTDGVNPFKLLSSKHSTWPVILIPYNLPPWIGMKQSSFLLSMIIPGPKGPGNDIDVYLQPLVDELKQLWDGVETLDSMTGETFKLRGAFLWTINDFPAYEMLFGRSTKGEFACLVCGDETSSRWLRKGGKFCYCGHRRWLESNHKFRAQGTVENRAAPTPLTGSAILEQTAGLTFTLGKGELKRAKRGRKKKARAAQVEDAGDGVDPAGDGVDPPAEPNIWKKRSIFFQLPYWHKILLRHNIDVMHCEKNVGVNFTGTMLGVKGITKDNFKTRQDLVEMGIRSDLHPFLDEKGKTQTREACYEMSKQEKELFCKVLKNLKLPDGYTSNLANSVNDKEHKLQGMKSHDYHILMQGILPVALRRSLPANVVKVVREVCLIFKGICSKVLDVNQLEELQSRAVQTLCQLETIFPPSFFTIMVHLLIHLVEEAKIAGPIHYRWMYPIERYLLRLKNYVRNRAHPEGSMTEGYLAEECATFCSYYIEGIETRYNRGSRNEDGLEYNETNYLFSSGGRKMGKVEVFRLDDITWVQAHRYVLFQHDEVQPFVENFLEDAKAKHRPRKYKQHQLDKLKNEKFHSWFANHVSTLNEGEVSLELKTIAVGPSRVACRFKSFIFNGTRFHTKDRERNLQTQNSGLLLKSQTKSYASNRDNNPVTSDLDYYGVLRDMIEIDYSGKYKVVLFKGDWVDVEGRRKGVKKDEFGFTIVNLSNQLYNGHNVSHEPFAISSQVQQVYYIQDPIDEDWHVVLKSEPRDAYDQEDDDQDDPDFVEKDTPLPEFDEIISWARTELHDDIIL